MKRLCWLLWLAGCPKNVEPEVPPPAEVDLVFGWVDGAWGGTRRSLISTLKTADSSEVVSLAGDLDIGVSHTSQGTTVAWNVRSLDTLNDQTTWTPQTARAGALGFLWRAPFVRVFDSGGTLVSFEDRRTAAAPLYEPRALVTEVVEELLMDADPSTRDELVAAVTGLLPASSDYDEVFAEIASDWAGGLPLLHGRHLSLAVPVEDTVQLALAWAPHEVVEHKLRIEARAWVPCHAKAKDASCLELWWSTEYTADGTVRRSLTAVVQPNGLLPWRIEDKLETIRQVDGVQQTFTRERTDVLSWTIR